MKILTASIKGFAYLFGATVLFLLALALWQHGHSPRTQQTIPHEKAWDGVKGHPDCSLEGHPDPDHPGVVISDRYTDACDGEDH